MRAFNKSSKDKIDEICDLYKAGTSINAIAKFEKVDRTTVYYWLRKFGLKKTNLIKNKYVRNLPK